MFEIDHGTRQPYRGPERRYAFFPRRLRNDGGDASGGQQGNDRRSGKDRRKRNGFDESVAAHDAK